MAFLILPCDKVEEAFEQNYISRLDKYYALAPRTEDELLLFKTILVDANTYTTVNINGGEGQFIFYKEFVDNSINNRPNSLYISQKYIDMKKQRLLEIEESLNQDNDGYPTNYPEFEQD